MNHLAQLLLLIVSAALPIIDAATIDNGITDPEVECASEGINIRFNTKEQFEGHVYVKGFFDDRACRQDATLDTKVGLDVSFQSCNVRRQRSSNPRGLYISVTVVIMFHPMFITMVDKAYNVQCFYMEADKTVTAELGVSMAGNQYQQVIVMLGGTDDDLQTLSGKLRNITPSDLTQLTTQTITQNVPMPQCEYRVLADNAQGAPVRFAAVGQQVYHTWSCTTEQDANGNSADGVFCMTVHSCAVDNGQGNRVQLLDEQGCANDKFLLNNLEYQEDLKGGQSSMVFKFADQPTLFFQCQIRLSLKEGGKCERTSDQCDEPVRGKRSVDTKEVQGADFDVFSESITVFDLDTPQANQERQAQQQLHNTQYQQQSSADFGRVSRDLDSLSSSFCMSPITFGALMAILGTVLLACLVAVMMLCHRHSNAHSDIMKIHPNI